MMCPKCSSESLRVIDVRPRTTGNANYRRRECMDCGHRFSTFELPEGQINELAEHIYSAKLKKNLSKKIQQMVEEAFEEMADFREDPTESMIKSDQ